MINFFLMLFKLFLIVSSILFLSFGQLQSQLNPEWVNTYNASGNGNDESLTHIVDDLGNLYSAGKIFQTSRLFDIYIVK